MTSAITGSVVTSFASELAELLIQTESAQQDSARLQRDAAREDFLQAAASQVKALHEAADDVRNGAWASAALSVASSACMIASSIDKFNADEGSAKLCLRTQVTTDDIAQNSKLAGEWGAIGKALDALSAPTKTLVGDAPAADANANAKFFETLAEKAKWLSGDASDEIEQAAKLGDKVLDLVQGINQDQNGSNTTLIGRI